MGNALAEFLNPHGDGRDFVGVLLAMRTREEGAALRRLPGGNFVGARLLAALLEANFKLDGIDADMGGGVGALDAAAFVIPLRADQVSAARAIALETARRHAEADKVWALGFLPEGHESLTMLSFEDARDIADCCLEAMQRQATHNAKVAQAIEQLKARVAQLTEEVERQRREGEEWKGEVE